MTGDPLRLAIVTGTRAEYGLLRSTLDAAAAHPRAEPLLIATGLHLSIGTEKHITHPIAARVPMQRPGETGRAADAEAVGRGITGLNTAYDELAPDVVLVLGDRIEAFAAASAAAIRGIQLAHVHGGDIARGVADDLLRNAISQLAQHHFPGTAASAARLRAMGIGAERIYAVGSPAADGLHEVQPAADPRDLLILHHPSGLPPEEEQRQAAAVLQAARAVARRRGWRIGLCTGNRDAGADSVAAAFVDVAPEERLDNLPRPRFLRELAGARVLVGNSSAGLIEAAVLRVPNVCVGTRQHGRETPPNTLRVAEVDAAAIEAAIEEAAALERGVLTHPYGDGQTGRRIVDRLVRRV